MADIHKPTRLLSEDEVAERFGIQPRTLQGWRVLRRGPRYRKIGRLVRYAEADLLNWLESRPVGGELPRRKSA
jgi:predicted DNA-binding transcriptional regulator AlpA